MLTRSDFIVKHFVIHFNLVDMTNNNALHQINIFLHSMSVHIHSMGYNQKLYKIFGDTLHTFLGFVPKLMWYFDKLKPFDH